MCRFRRRRGMIGEIRRRDQDRAHLARERQPKIEEIESIRWQDRRARPRCVIMKRVDRCCHRGRGSRFERHEDTPG